MKHLIPVSASLREAFSALNTLSGANMTLFAIDEERRLAGSLTDGDLRRAIIGGGSLSDSVSRAINTGCMKITAGGTDRYTIVAEARRRGITLLPIVDTENRITDLLDLRKLKADLPLDAVLMAGGRGERLRPLTLDCPKPLLNVGDRPIIDYNIDELRANGIDNIFVTVNYLKDQIIGHFRNPRFDGKVRCIEEPRRLGTMGSLSLIPDSQFRHANILVMNSDLLTTLNYEKLFLHHINSGAAMTIAAIPYSVSIPYAILKCEGTRVLGLTEKPTFNHFANAGVYIMRREIIREHIPSGEYLDAPDLIENIIKAGLRVEFFPIDGTWIDIGSPDDYRYANELMSSGRPT